MRTTVRWLVPVAVGAAVVSGVAVTSAQAGSTPQVPERTPQQVIASVAGSDVTALSGTVVTRADLGLPSVSGLVPRSTSAADPAGLLTRFLTGKNTVRVWADGPTRQRAQLIDPFSEVDVVRNGTEVWTYTSRGNTVQHGTLPARTARTDRKPDVADLTPAQAADRAIAAAGPTTAVTLGEPQTVAGRSAYSLTLTPKTSGTLVARIVIAVDAQRGVPLRVQVFARGKGQPAIETGFTSVSFAKPDAERFTFTPPKGATVTPLEAPKAAAEHPKLPAADRPTVTGDGWTTIVEVPASALRDLAGEAAAHGTGPTASGSGDAASPGAGLAALDGLTTPAGNGGRAVTSSLVSVLFTADGRILAGSVPVQALVDAAAKK